MIFVIRRVVTLRSFRLAVLLVDRKQRNMKNVTVIMTDEAKNIKYAHCFLVRSDCDFSEDIRCCVRTSDVAMNVYKQSGHLADFFWFFILKKLLNFIGKEYLSIT